VNNKKKESVMDGLTASPYKKPSGLRHAESLDNVSWVSSPRKKYWPAINQNCPLHGSRGKCTCASFVNDDHNGVENDGMGSSDSLHRSGDFGQQYHEINGSNDDLVPPSVKPFNNNPPLPSTQRDIIGNNLHFNSSQSNDWIDNENDQLAALLLYRDALKRNLTTPAKAGGGLPRMRHGRVGSQWRHIKQTNTYSGSNLMFIDGTVRIDDIFKYPIPHFGYPPMKRPQHKFSTSYNDLSLTSSNPTTQSLDTSTWSRVHTSNRRPSVSQYSSRHQRSGKDNFPYWPIDSTSKKPRSLNHSTDENNEHEINNQYRNV